MKCKTNFTKMVIKNNFLCVELNITPKNPIFVANMDFHLMHNRINNKKFNNYTNYWQYCHPRHEKCKVIPYHTCFMRHPSQHPMNLLFIGILLSFKYHHVKHKTHETLKFGKKIENI